MKYSKVKSSDVITVISNAKIKNIIFRYLEKPFNGIAKERLYSLFAAKYLMDNKKEVSDSVKLVLPSYIEDSANEVNKYLKSVYDNAKCYNYFTLNKNKVSLKEAINISLSSIFDKTVIFNNEQVNKNNISSVTSKARNIIVDDILDTGRTLKAVKELLIAHGAKSVKVCVLLDKPEGRKEGITADYVGGIVPNEFVVGYGLDYNDLYRNLPYVGVLKDEIYSK